jgi:hypothetical protein
MMLCLSIILAICQVIIRLLANFQKKMKISVQNGKKQKKITTFEPTLSNYYITPNDHFF